MNSPISGTPKRHTRKPIVIACAADDRYVKPLGVMIKSALVNLCPDRSVNIYIVDGGIKPRHKTELTASWDRPDTRIEWLPAATVAFAGAPLWGRMPAATYLKLGVADLLPKSVRKAIWFDCDLLVVADISRLWDLDLGGHHLLAAQDRVVPLVSSPCGISRYTEMGLSRRDMYFNAGVMVLNLDLWRRDGVAERALDYLRQNRDDVFFWDQEGLNAVLAGKWGQLDSRWNHNANLPSRWRFPARPVRASAGAAMPVEPKIIHFAGNLKPWLHVSKEVPRALYYHYLDMTVWAGWRPVPSWTRRLAARYGSSTVRAAIYPAELWGIRMLRLLSRRYVNGARPRV